MVVLLLLESSKLFGLEVLVEWPQVLKVTRRGHLLLHLHDGMHDDETRGQDVVSGWWVMGTDKGQTLSTPSVSFAVEYWKVRKVEVVKGRGYQ